MKTIPPNSPTQIENCYQPVYRTFHHKLLIALLIVVAAGMGVKAQDCPPDSSNGGQSLAVSLTVQGTGQ
jgi:hypothetical protein